MAFLGSWRLWTGVDPGASPGNLLICKDHQSIRMVMSDLISIIDRLCSNNLPSRRDLILPQQETLS